jgi:hypothetical protein
MTVPKCFEVDPVQFRIGVAARDRVNHPSGACLSVRYTCIIPPDAQWDRCRNQGTFQLRKPASPRTANFDYDSQWNPCAPAGSTHGLFVTYSWIDFVYGLKATGRIAGQIAAAFVQCSRQSSETFFSPKCHCSSIASTLCFIPLELFGVGTLVCTEHGVPHAQSSFGS